MGANLLKGKNMLFNKNKKQLETLNSQIQHL